jgi:hypothetical protein
VIKQQNFGGGRKVMLFRKMERVKAFERIAFEAGVILSAVEREVMEKIDFSDVEVRAILAWELKKEELRREAYDRKDENRRLKKVRESLDKKLDKLY